MDFANTPKDDGQPHFQDPTQFNPYPQTPRTDIEQCEHESDGLSYLSYPPQSRCKKCGQFYR